MSYKAQAIIDELVTACIEFGLIQTGGRLTRLKKARQELHEYIAELEEKQRWIPVSERLPEEEGWYYAGVLGRFGDHYTHDVYFYAEDIAFRWKDCEGDKVYCWLDGVPELPEPPEVQDVSIL